MHYGADTVTRVVQSINNGSKKLTSFKIYNPKQ